MSKRERARETIFIGDQRVDGVASALVTKTADLLTGGARDPL